MKHIYTLILACLSFCSYSNTASTLLNQLSAINRYWLVQTDIVQLPIHTPANTFTHHQLIQLHLQLVEKTLRARNTGHLSEAQKAARNKNLDNLNIYWKTNIYPTNNKVVNINPVFIDDYNVFCAVGYLIKT